MKVLKILLITFAAFVVIGIIGVFVLFKTFDIDRFKPQIIAGLSDALGRRVDFEDIDLRISLKQGIHLSLNQLEIGDDAAFQNKDFLTVKNISLGLKILPLLRKRQILISAISIDSARCIIIRRKDGQLNVQNLGKSVYSKHSPPGTSKRLPEKIPVSRAVAGVPLIFAETIEIKNAKIIYIDHSYDPEFILDISRVRLEINQFSLTRPFAFKLQAASLSDQPNIFVKGSLSVDINARSIKFKDMTVTTDLSSYSFSRLQLSEGIELPQQLKGSLKLDIKEIEAGQNGLVSLIGSGELTAGSVKHKQLALPVEPIGLSFQMTELNINIEELLLGFGKGRLIVNGELNDYLKAQNFNLSVNIRDLDLAKLIARGQQPMKLEGLVMGNFSCRGRGFTPDTLRSHLRGEGSVEIKNGRLIDINVLRVVLDKISMLPGLVTEIETALPERYKQKLTCKDTILTKVSTDLAVENGQFLLKSTQIEADGFLFSGGGKLDFDQRFVFSGLLFIPQDLAASMVDNVSELECLLDENSEICIPLEVSGRGSDIKFSVDLKDIAKKFIRKKASEELGSILDELFDKESSSQAADEDAPAEEEKPVERQIIENVLDAIFK